MPELPEVETVRRGLETLVLGQEIVAVTLKVPKMVKTDLETFALTLPGQIIQSVGRRGKYLLIDLGQLVLVSHLRMEGKYLLFPDEVPDNKHFHVFFELKRAVRPSVLTVMLWELMAPCRTICRFMVKLGNRVLVVDRLLSN